MNISRCLFATFFAYSTLLCISPPLYCQDNTKFRELFRQAEYFVITEEYEKAIQKYNELLDIDPDNSNLNFLMGYSMINANFPAAESVSHLEYAVQNVTKDYSEGSHFERSAPPLAYFLLGKAYMKDYKFDNASQLFKEYKSNIDYWDFAENEYITRYINACETAKIMVKNPLDVEMEMFDFAGNNKASVGEPVVSGNESVMLFHLDNLKDNGIAMITKLDSTHWSQPGFIDAELDITEDHYPSSISYDGKTLYLIVHDDISADIYESHFDGSSWSKASKLESPVNTKYLETHASISKDGNTLYFTSNRKNGWGGMDIYRCKKNQNGKWKNVENLGFGINTFYNEETPFIANNDSTLYFSSEGHNTMGGYDIFYADIDENGEFSNIGNMGYPISTPDDDLFFNPVWNSDKNYIVRQVKDNPKRAEIYCMVLKPQPIPEELFAWNNPDSAALLEESSGKLSHKENQVAIAQEVNEPDKETQSSSDTENINDQQKEAQPDKINTELSENSISDAQKQVKTIQNAQPVKARENSSLISQFYYIQNSVFFSFNSWEVDESFYNELNRLASMMKLYESVNIELIGNADSIGSFEYNYELAKNRANAVKQYIVNQGVSSDRIMIDVHGEAYPLAANSFQSGRAINRNVLIRIDNSGVPNVQVAEMFVPSNLIPEHDKIYCIYLTDSKQLIDSIPRTIDGLPVTLVYTRSSKVYTLGSFNSKLDAIAHLDKTIDMGFEKAGIMERRRFENVIREKSGNSDYATANYTLQIYALKNPMKSLPVINQEKVRVYKGKDDFFRYVCGEYKTVQEASASLTTIKKKGFENAFIRPLIYYQVTAAE